MTDRTKRPRQSSARPKPDARRTDTRRPRASTPERDDKKLLRIAGLPAVEALHAHAAGRIDRLYFLAETRGSVGNICVTLAKAHKAYKIVRPDELERIAGTNMHGGVVALAEPPVVARFDSALAEIWGKAGQAVVVLDGIGNPHNLGAIVRTAAFFGVRHVLLSDHAGQAAPSDAAYRVARGGMEHVDFTRVEQFPEQLRRLKRSHQVVATALDRGVPLAALKRDARPVALILGNEEEGVGSAVLDAADAIVMLPGAGAVQSLNVAATAAILIHALMVEGG